MVCPFPANLHSTPNTARPWTLLFRPDRSHQGLRTWIPDEGLSSHMPMLLVLNLERQGADRQRLPGCRRFLHVRRRVHSLHADVCPAPAPGRLHSTLARHRHGSESGESPLATVRIRQRHGRVVSMHRGDDAFGSGSAATTFRTSRRTRLVQMAREIRQRRQEYFCTIS